MRLATIKPPGMDHAVAAQVVDGLAVAFPAPWTVEQLLSVDAAGAHLGQPGYETDLLYIAGLIALVIGGSGPLSLDGMIARRLYGKR